MLKFKFMIINSILIFSCFNVVAMQNKNILESTTLNKQTDFEKNLTADNKNNLNKIIKDIENLEKTNFKNICLDDIENIRNKLTDYKIKINNNLTDISDKEEFSFLMEKISNLYLKLFEESIVKLKTEKIESKQTNEISVYIDIIEIFIQDLIKLKQEYINELTQNKINELINKFYNINLYLIKIYATKTGEQNFKNMLTESTKKSQNLLFCLYKYKEYLEKIEKKEIDEQTKKQLNETIKVVSTAQYKMIKNYYINYIMLIDFKKITKPTATFHLKLLNKIKNDSHNLLDEVDCPKINYAIKKFSEVKNK